MSQEITRENSVKKQIDGIDYTFSQHQGKLLVTILNSTGKPLTLTSKSSVSDASGRLVFLPSQSIDAGLEAHIAIPPPPGVDPNLRRPTAAESAPTGEPFEGGIYPDERVVRSIENESPKFVWTDGTNIALTLVFDIGKSEPLTHAFVVQRAK